jgi:uncharacterized protein (DUF1697 family)
MPSFVALLRGVNVGGSRKLPMKDLAALLAGLGLEDVVTYIQSGNVVFRAPAGGRPKLVRRIEEAIAEEFGLDVTVMLRTGPELARIVDANPYLDGGAEISKLHVAFLDRKPPQAAVARLDPERSPPDEFAVRGTEIYLRFPAGYGRTKLGGDYFERVLGVRATARNWRTVTKLLELASQARRSA